MEGEGRGDFEEWRRKGRMKRRKRGKIERGRTEGMKNVKMERGRTT